MKRKSTPHIDQRIFEEKVVRAWIEDNTTFSEILEEHSEDHPICGALKNLHMTTQNDGCDPEILAWALPTIEALKNRDLRVLSLIMAASSVTGAGQRDLALSVLARVSAEMEQFVHPLLLQSAATAAGNIFNWFGEEDRAAAMFDRAATACRFAGPRETRIWLTQARFRIMRLEGRELYPRLELINLESDPVTADIARGLLWIHDTITGLCRLPQPDLPPLVCKMLEGNLFVAAGWRARFMGQPPVLPEPISSPEWLDSLQEWLQALEAIDHHRLNEAWTLTASLRQEGQRSPLDMHSHLSDSIQLALGQTLDDVALNTLLSRRAAPHPFDALHLARHFRLAGNQVAARQRLGEAMNHSHTFQLDKRFADELARCHEVPVLDWLGHFGKEPSSRYNNTEDMSGTKNKSLRMNRLCTLLMTHRHLHRDEVAQRLSCSRTTASRDLNELVGRGLVAKRTPTLSKRSHYFEWLAPS